LIAIKISEQLELESSTPTYPVPVLLPVQILTTVKPTIASQTPPTITINQTLPTKRKEWVWVYTTSKTTQPSKIYNITICKVLN